MTLRRTRMGLCITLIGEASAGVVDEVDEVQQDCNTRLLKRPSRARIIWACTLLVSSEKPSSSSPSLWAGSSGSLSASRAGPKRGIVARTESISFCFATEGRDNEPLFSGSSSGASPNSPSSSSAMSRGDTDEDLEDESDPRLRLRPPSRRDSIRANPRSMGDFCWPGRR